MNYKQIAGLGALIVGIGLIFYGIQGRGKMERARGQINTGDQFIPKNSFTDAVKKDLYARVDKHELPVILLFIGGGVLIIGGSATIILARNQKKRR